MSEKVGTNETVAGWPGAVAVTVAWLEKLEMSPTLSVAAKVALVTVALMVSLGPASSRKWSKALCVLFQVQVDALVVCWLEMPRITHVKVQPASAATDSARTR